jgi:3D (Asp-Asp-Asp) domain-containing protein
MPLITNLLITAYITTGHFAANNHPPVVGTTVAGPRSIPLGTHIHIDGFTNDFIINDRTAKHYDGRIDIFYGEDLAGAKKWGIQKRKVTICLTK